VFSYKFGNICFHNDETFTRIRTDVNAYFSGRLQNLAAP
jgi:hypothetical protein